MESNSKINEILEAMNECMQTENLSVYRHGEMVKEYFIDLYNYLETGQCSYEWKLPEWIDEYRDYLINVIHKYDIEKILNYHLYHDCGKPFCKVIDSDGKTHFPNHTDISYNIWMYFGKDKWIGNMIKQDMDIHLLKAVDVNNFCKKPDAVILLLTGLCEIHANASMFGGFDSVSFKIKWKRISSRGKAILNILHALQYSIIVA